MDLEGKRVLVTGGTGSLGQVLVQRLLTQEIGRCAKITVFSRDEAKQHAMRLRYQDRNTATDDIIYRDSQELLSFWIGDVRDYDSISAAMSHTDVVFHAAALKQVPTCEYFPSEAVRTNILGAENIVRATREGKAPVELVVGISTDKACKPVNVMGMTKAVQERILLAANLDSPTRFVCVRYGNVLASRGSVIPVFIDQIKAGRPVTVTTADMTRFLLDLNRAVDTVFAATRHARPGETYIPKVESARVVDIAETLIGGRDLPIVFTGMRPGEKVHEVLISEEECQRSYSRGDYFAIAPLLPELRDSGNGEEPVEREYSSRDITLAGGQLESLLKVFIDDLTATR